MVVSVEPIIVPAIKPINESTPNLDIISVATAIEALPDIGLSKARGSIWLGNLKKLNSGFKILVKKSIIPEALSKYIDKNNPNNVGKIFNIICIPSLEPCKKLSKTDCFSNIPYTTIKNIVNGIAKLDIYVIKDI